jgi:hypothetical protein
VCNLAERRRARDALGNAVEIADDLLNDEPQAKSTM